MTNEKISINSYDENVMAMRKQILKQAVDSGKLSKENALLFESLDLENIKSVSDNDFNAFCLLKQQDGTLVLSDKEIKALKLFDINNDGTFSDAEFNLLKLAHDIGGNDAIMSASLYDFDKNGVLGKKEIKAFGKALKNIANNTKETKKTSIAKENKQEKTSVETEPKINNIPEKVNKKETNLSRLSKIFASKKEKDEVQPQQIPSWSGKSVKEVLSNVKDKKSFEKLLSETDKDGNTLLHIANADEIKEILNVIMDNYPYSERQELVKEILSKKNNNGKPVIYSNYDNNDMVKKIQHCVNMLSATFGSDNETKDIQLKWYEK